MVGGWFQKFTCNLLFFAFCSCPICAIWIVASISQQTHSERWWICVKIWAFDIRKNYHCANHWSRPIWSATIRHFQNGNFRPASMRRRVNILHRLPTPIHSYRRIRRIFTTATEAWIRHRMAHFSAHPFNIRPHISVTKCSQLAHRMA